MSTPHSQNIATTNDSEALSNHVFVRGRVVRTIMGDELESRRSFETPQRHHCGHRSSRISVIVSPRGNSDIASPPTGNWWRPTQ